VYYASGIKLAASLIVLLSGCSGSELLGTWVSEQPLAGVSTKLAFRSDGWVVHEETDVETQATMDRVRFRWRVEGDKLRQEARAGRTDSATGCALEADRLTLVAFRPLGAHDGIVGRWRFEREAWGPPGTDGRTQRWEMAFDAEGRAGLSERYDTRTRAIDLGTWERGERDGSFFVEVAPDREEYLLLGEVLTPATAVFRRE
jgi:hypothetical protein